MVTLDPSHLVASSQVRASSPATHSLPAIARTAPLMGGDWEARHTKWGCSRLTSSTTSSTKPRPIVFVFALTYFAPGGTRKKGLGTGLGHTGRF